MNNYTTGLIGNTSYNRCTERILCTGIIPITVQTIISDLVGDLIVRKKMTWAQ